MISPQGTEDSQRTPENFHFNNFSNTSRAFFLARNALTLTFDSDQPVTSATSLTEAPSPSLIISASRSSDGSVSKTRSARFDAISFCSASSDPLPIDSDTLSSQAVSSSLKSEVTSSGRRLALRSMFKQVFVAIRVSHPSIEPRPAKLFI